MIFTPIARNSHRRTAVLVFTALILNLLVVSPASSGHVVPQAGAAPFVRLLNAPVNDIVYNKQSRKLLVSVPSRVGAGGNSITELDPITGALGISVFVGSEPNKLAISDDGQTAYVGIDGAASVRRVDMSTHTAGTQFRLGSDQGSGTVQVLRNLVNYERLYKALQDS